GESPRALLLLVLARLPRSTLFPYTTLFRSRHRGTSNRRTAGAGCRGRARTPARNAAATRRAGRRSDAPARARGAPRHSHRSARRSEEHTSELQSRENLVCRLLLEKKKQNYHRAPSHLPNSYSHNSAQVGSTTRRSNSQAKLLAAPRL